MSEEKRIYRDFIGDIYAHIKKIEEFTDGIDYETFMKDEKTVYAVVRCFEIIGEAVKKIPPSLKDKHPGIPWNKMSGMRNILIHEYFGVDYETLWATVQSRIPELKPLIEKILKDSSRKK